MHHFKKISTYFSQKTKSVATYSLSMFFALLLFFGIVIVYAWTEPASAPPAGNVSAPVNVGGTSQYKSGALGVGGVFHGYSTGIFDGNVGIGTTSPAAMLHILSNANADIRLGESDSLMTNIRWNIASNQAEWDTDSYAYPIKLNGNRVILQDASGGNVGIGTTTPSAKLDIQTSNGSDAFKINTYKMVPISSTELGVYDSNNNQVLIFDQGN